MTDRPTAVALLWMLRRAFPGPLFRLAFLRRAEGIERVPVNRPVVIAGNHLSFLDPVLIQLLLRRRIVFLAKHQFFLKKGPTGFLTRRFLKFMGIPVDRAGGRSAAETLVQARQVLADGGAIGIFPEGTMSTDGRLYRGHTGVARLALDSGAPIIPVALRYHRSLRLPSRFVSRIGRATVLFDDPIDPECWAGQANTGVYRDVTDAVMQAVQRLSGQDYIDVYAPRSCE